MRVINSLLILRQQVVPRGISLRRMALAVRYLRALTFDSNPVSSKRERKERRICNIALLPRRAIVPGCCSAPRIRDARRLDPRDWRLAAAAAAAADADADALLLLTLTLTLSGSVVRLCRDDAGGRKDDGDGGTGSGHWAGERQQGKGKCEERAEQERAMLRGCRVGSSLVMTGQLRCSARVKSEYLNVQ